MSDEAGQKTMRKEIKLIHSILSQMVRRVKHGKDHLKILNTSYPCPILDKATCRKLGTLLCLPYARGASLLLESLFQFVSLYFLGHKEK